MCIFLLSLIVTVGTFVGCGEGSLSGVPKLSVAGANRNAKVAQALQKALAASTNTYAVVWRQFMEKWPSARPRKGFVWREDLNKLQGNVSAGTDIEGRYAFAVILDFEMGPDNWEVQFVKLRLHLAEVKQVIVPPDGASRGGVTVYFQPDQKWFGLKEWEKFVESNWNFSSIGINIISNNPIVNIQDALQTF